VPWCHPWRTQWNRGNGVARGSAPPKFHTSNRTRAGDGLESAVRGDGNACEQLNALCEAYCEDQLLRFKRKVSFAEAAPVIYRRHPELTRQWHEEQQGR
jgi:hypothetical protein